MKLIIAITVLCLLATAALAQQAASARGDVLANLAPAHPRLILTTQRVAELKDLAQTDAVLKQYLQQAVAQADKCIGAKPLEHKLIGPRLLQVSRECVRRAYALGLAWRMTGREKYAAALKDNLLTVCGFADWNPSHFLDVAEMTHAVGVGYDWLYDYLSADDRKRIAAGLFELGIKPGLAAYNSRAWWVSSEFNWNQVCNSGLAIGALAVADERPTEARSIIASAVASLPKAIASYEPDGAWGEGPGYWRYATDYTVFGLAAMQTALGTDFGLGDTKSLARAGYFPLYTAGPTGLFVNYADAGERSALRPAAVLFWLARRYDDPALAAAQHKLLASRQADPLDVIWYYPPPKAAPAVMDLDRKFGGPVELAVFRSAWDDAGAIFAAIKAGYNRVNHGHLDLGTFELDALGQRWARDLGSDDYNLPGYWDGNKDDGRRWTYYRLGSFSHNVVTLDGRQQLVDGKARMTHFQAGGNNAGGDRPCAVVDLTSAYAPRATKALRGLALVAGRKAVLVQDELTLAPAEGAKDVQVTWGMTTDAEIALDGATAVLTLGGKKLTARILRPAGAKFNSGSCEQQPPQKANKGIRRLEIAIRQGKRNLTIAVLLSPAWPAEKPHETADVKPLEQWGK
ncbi:MAG: heparinase II/III family protein [Phycisphaerae bacterium]